MKMITRNNKIKQLYKKGLSYGSIAKLFGISRARIHQIVSSYTIPRSELSQSIFARDNLTCQWGKKCFNKPVPINNLIIHHINFNNKDNRQENLITLCRKCHGSFHSNNHIDDNVEHKLRYHLCKLAKPQNIIAKDREDYMNQYRQKNRKRISEYQKEYLKKYKQTHGKSYYQHIVKQKRLLAP